MIHVDVSTAVCLYVMSTLLITFVFWVLFEKETTLPKYVREEANVWECSICAHTYIDSTNFEISQCPQCKSYNKKSIEDRIL